jgi:ribosomal protein S18 acetylase RimI-like enzyme
MVPAYASVLAVAFAESPDLALYPKLGTREGCKELVREIGESPGFLPGASWLVLFSREPCALVLTSRTGREAYGNVLVVAVAPRHRRVRVGTHLVTKALWAFRDRRLERGEVKVNRSNRTGVIFFRSLGFQAAESETFMESVD